MGEHRLLQKLWPPLLTETERDRERKPWDDGNTSGSTGTLKGNRSGRGGLKEGADVAFGE
jgi:hypothetical protein